MKFTKIETARAIRDSGVDAVAALESQLADVLIGLSPEEEVALKRIVGEVMGEIVEKLINPAVRSFPQLKLDEATWAAIVSDRVKSRAGQKI